MLGWESGEIGWVESFVEIDHPAAVEEVASGNEHVAGVIAFTAEGGGVVGGGEELGNDVGNSEAGLLHEEFGGHATSKSRFFDGVHLIGGDEHGLREGVGEASTMKGMESMNGYGGCRPGEWVARSQLTEGAKTGKVPGCNGSGFVWFWSGV